MEPEKSVLVCLSFSFCLILFVIVFFVSRDAMLVVAQVHYTLVFYFFLLCFGFKVQSSFAPPHVGNEETLVQATVSLAENTGAETFVASRCVSVVACGRKISRCVRAASSFFD